MEQANHLSRHHSSMAMETSDRVNKRKQSSGVGTVAMQAKLCGTGGWPGVIFKNLHAFSRYFLVANHLVNL